MKVYVVIDEGNSPGHIYGIFAHFEEAENFVEHGAHLEQQTMEYVDYQHAPAHNAAIYEYDLRYGQHLWTSHD